MERQRPDTFIRAIDGAGCRGSGDFFVEVARAFRFPDGFGYNWPAFTDMIRDLGWLSAPGYVLVITAADRTFSASGNGPWRQLSATLDDTADADIPLHVVLVTDRPQSVADRLAPANIAFATHLAE